MTLNRIETPLPSRLSRFFGLQRRTTGGLAMVVRVGMGERMIVSFTALGGAFPWQISPQANLITAFVFGVIGTVGFAAFGRDMPAFPST